MMMNDEEIEIEIDNDKVIEIDHDEVIEIDDEVIELIIIWQMW